MFNHRSIHGFTKYLSPRDQIDLICDSFEDAWIHGAQPELRDYLHDLDLECRSELFQELLLVDLEYRNFRGVALNKQDYLARFPEFADLIEASLLEHEVASTKRLGEFETCEGYIGQERSVAHFQLLQRVGRGAVGDVWKAWDTRLQRHVALKIPRNRFLSDDELRRFIREGQAAAQLRHPNIVSIYEVGRGQGSMFIISELVDGCDLKSKLMHSESSYKSAAVLCAQLADALHHAHELGVVHRDLKPANILIDSTGRPKITDFGLAKWIEDASEMTLAGQILGTPAYISPEQAQGATAVERRTDVYSLGVILYEMLTKKLPFSGDQAAVLQAAIHEEPQSLRKVDRSVPQDLETICLKAMEKKPENRYSSAMEMANDLNRYLRGEPILARRSSSLERGWKLICRRKAMAGILVSSLTAAGSLGMASLLSKRNRELLGFRTVRLDTVPSGAKVSFVPLSKSDGEPEFDQAIFCDRVSPVETALQPGEYLIVAVICFTGKWDFWDQLQVTILGLG